MPGCAHNAGSLHMTIQTAVLIEALKVIISYLCWCYLKTFSVQYHNVAVIMRDESAALFSCEGDIFE